jgi:hypothetical protein|tara:strand:- start:1137 stop:2303 length:1167 start_codon:yes stop_codon:yes gene_type:complete
MLSVAILVWLYVNLLQVQAGVHRHIAQGARHLQVQQQRWWDESLHQRRLKRGQMQQGQQAFDAWWPVHQLSCVLMILQPYQQLINWQWQSINTGQQVVFTVTGKGRWQDWWQKAIKVWPSLQVEALRPKPDGWTLEARYLIAALPLSLPLNTQLAAPKAHVFAIQLTPQFLSGGDAGVGTEVEVLGSMMRQVANYGQGIEIVRGQGVQIKIRLDATHWAGLAPLPSALGWRLQDLSVQQTPSQQWLVSMQWLLNHDKRPFHLLRQAPTTELQATTYESIEHYAQAFQDPLLRVQVLPMQRTLASINPVRGKVQLAEDFVFMGYSQQQGQAPVAWFKVLISGQLLRAEVGHEIDNWRVSAIGAQGVKLTLGQQSVTLKRPCLKQVCQLE